MEKEGGKKKRERGDALLSNHPKIPPCTEVADAASGGPSPAAGRASAEADEFSDEHRQDRPAHGGHAGAAGPAGRGVAGQHDALCFIFSGVF